MQGFLSLAHHAARTPVFIQLLLKWILSVIPTAQKLVKLRGSTCDGRKQVVPQQSVTSARAPARMFCGTLDEQLHMSNTQIA
jgi:hypothetical protein